MKRYCVCKVYGEQFGDPDLLRSERTPTTGIFRAAIEDVLDPQTGFPAFNTAVIIATDQETGLPIHDWCLVYAAGDNFKLVEDNPDIDLLPDVSLDVKVSAIHTPTKIDMGVKLQARGIDTSFIGNSDGMHDVVRGIGKLHAEDFNEKKFDVSDV